MDIDLEHLCIRPLELRHLAAVVEIEHCSFPTPWSPWLFEAFLASPSSRIFLLLRPAPEEKACVFGYLCLALSEHCAHILKLAVHPSCRRRGVAHRLLHHAVDYAANQGAVKAELEVREGNRAAQNLYRTFGFRPNGARQLYYQDTKEHALVYYLDLLTFVRKEHPVE